MIMRVRGSGGMAAALNLVTDILLATNSIVEIDAQEDNTYWLGINVGRLDEADHVKRAIEPIITRAGFKVLQ